MSAFEDPWIGTGYEIFAYEGPHGLKVERLARAVGKNKSSFYHFFADLELFMAALLECHLQRTKLLATKESGIGDLEGLISVLVEHKLDLLFSRQLRVHRHIPEFEACFSKSNEISLPSFIPVWASLMDLKDHSYLSEMVLHLAIDNFFLQITDESLEADWLRGYFRNLQSLVAHFKRTGKASSLDGTV